MLPDIIRTVINTAMQIEQQNHLSAAPYERTAERQGHANSCKPKTVITRAGKITFDVPQVREGGLGIIVVASKEHENLLGRQQEKESSQQTMYDKIVAK